MKWLRMIRLNKARYLDESDVPQSLRKRVEWERVFRGIPVGKARMIRSEEAHYTRALNAV